VYIPDLYLVTSCKRHVLMKVCKIRFKKTEDQTYSPCSVLVTKQRPLPFLVYSNIIFIKSMVFGLRVSANVTRDTKSYARRSLSSEGNGNIDGCYSHEDINGS